MSFSVIRTARTASWADVASLGASSQFKRSYSSFKMQWISDTTAEMIIHMCAFWFATDTNTDFHQHWNNVSCIVLSLMQESTNCSNGCVVRTVSTAKHAEEFRKSFFFFLIVVILYYIILYWAHTQKYFIHKAGSSSCEPRLRAAERDKDEIQEAAVSLAAAKGISLNSAVAVWHFHIKRTALWCCASPSERQRPSPL